MLLLPLQLRCRRNPGLLLMLLLSPWLRHGRDPGLHLLLLLPLSRPLLLRLLLLLLPLREEFLGGDGGGAVAPEDPRGPVARELPWLAPSAVL